MCPQRFTLVMQMKGLPEFMTSVEPFREFVLWYWSVFLGSLQFGRSHWTWEVRQWANAAVTRFDWMVAYIRISTALGPFTGWMKYTANFTNICFYASPLVWFRWSQYSFIKIEKSSTTRINSVNTNIDGTIKSEYIKKIKAISPQLKIDAWRRQ